MQRTLLQHAIIPTLLLGAAIFASLYVVAFAQSPSINYQGKLTDENGLAVANGTYDMEFRLYATATSGSPVWTEVLSGPYAVEVENGLFSIMLGASSSLAAVDFTQTLYLGVTIENDSEMTPRKMLGTVPAAFESKTLGGVASTSFVRSDDADTISASTSAALLTITQTGSGDILNLFDGSDEVFSVLDGGSVGIGSTTPSAKLTVSGSGYFGGNVTATGTLSVAGNASLQNASTTNLTIANFLYDSVNSAGTLGMVLQATGTSTRWVATSTLGIGASFSNSAELAALLSDETGTGAFVLSSSPAFGGTATFSALTATSTVTLSGTAANIALGSNFLSGDGDDEGVYVDGSGNVGIGTTSPTAVAGTRVLELLSSSNGGSELILGTPDASFGSGGFAGGVVFKNVDTAGARPHYAGIKAKSAGSGFMNLNFFSGRDNYENDTAQMTLYYTGNLGIGSTTPSAKLTVSGSGYFGGNLYATGTLTALGNSSLQNASTTNLTIANFLYDSVNSAGTLGMVLQATGTSTRWVATSTLGISSGANVLDDLTDVNTSGVVGGNVLAFDGSNWIDFATSSLDLGPTGLMAADFGDFSCDGSTCSVDSGALTAAMQADGDHGFFSYASGVAALDTGGLSSADLLASLSDETGTGFSVFSASPTFTGTAIFANSTTTNLGVTGTFRDSVNSAGTLGMVLQATGTSTRWVATSTLGGSAAFSNSAELAALLSDEQGTSGGFVRASSSMLTNAALVNASSTSGITLGGVTYLTNLTASRALFNDANNRATTTGTSAFLSASLSDETGTGAAVFGTNPTISNASSTNITLAGVNYFTNLTASRGLFLDALNRATTTGASADLLASLSDETGTGFSVFSASPTFTGTAIFANSTTTNLGVTGTFRDSVNSAGTLGMVLQATGTSTRWVATSTLGISSGANVLDDLTDVNTSGVVGGNVLAFDGSNWIDFATSSLDLGPTGLMAADFGDFSCDGSTCSFDSDTISDSEIDFSTVTLNDFTNDSAYLTDISNESFLDLTDTQSSFTANRIIFTNSGGNALTDSAGLVFANSNLGIGSTTPSAKLTVTGDAYFGGNVTATGTLSVAGNASLQNASTTNLTIANFLYDSVNSAGTLGMVLQATGTSTRWVATSTLGIGASFSNSAELAALLSDETGTGAFVLSSSPAFGGTATFSALTATSTVTLSGNTSITNASSTSGITLGGVTYLTNLTASRALFNDANNRATTTGTSAFLSASLSDETGTGAAVFGTNPTISNASSTNMTLAGVNYLTGLTASRGLFLDALNRATTTGASADLLASLSDETGTGFSVFSASPTFTGTAIFANSTTTNLGVTGTFRDSVNSAGTLGMVLQATGTSTRWVATSTLGIGASFSNSAELAALLSDEQGTSGGFVRASSSMLTNAALVNASSTSGITLGGVTYLTNLTASRALFNDANNRATTTGTSAFLSASLSDETGTGAAVFGTNPTISNASSTNMTLAGVNYFTNLTASRGLFLDALNRATTTGASADLLASLSDETGTGFSVFSASPTFTGTAIFANSTTTNLGVTGTFRDSVNSAGTLGMVLQATGTSTRWVATSTLGGSAAFSNSAELAALLSDETGTGAFVLSSSPAFGGTATFSALTATSTVTLSGTAANIALGSNFLSGDGQDEGVFVDSIGRVGLGTTTPTTLLTVASSSITGTSTFGTNQHFVLANASNGAVQFGNHSYIVASANTATSTLVGDIIRIVDSTGLGNVVRGLEVQAERGTNTLGENTGLSGFGRTFGVRGTTRGDAGALYEPAGGYFETEGTTQGNAVRAYSNDITSATLMALFQETSTFSGTGLQMNFGNSGSFTGNFLDLQNAGTSKFLVSQHGTTTIGDGTTNNMAGLQIGYGGICVDNDGTCVASTTGRISAVSYHTGNSDLAEMYFSSQDLEPGEIVYAQGGLSVARAHEGAREQILGVVSTKPGLTLGFDDTPTGVGESGYPVALTGRVPIKLSTENGPIAVGDQIALSSIPGVGMKARPGDVVVGSALEAFDGTQAYSDGYVNQFGDDIRIPNTKPHNVNDDARINDGCSFGGGGAIGASGAVPCTPTVAGAATNESERSEEAVEAAAEQLAEIADLASIPAETVSVASGTVAVGKVLMFVKLGRFDDIRTADIMRDLLATSTDIVVGGEGESLWDRIKSLAQNFVDGVLTVTRLKARSVEVEDQFCVDDVCVTADDLRRLLDGNGSGTPTPTPTPPSLSEPGTEDEQVPDGGEEDTETSPDDASNEEESGEVDSAEPVPVETPPLESEDAPDSDAIEEDDDEAEQPAETNPTNQTE